MKTFEISAISRTVDGFRYTIRMQADNYASCRRVLERATDDLIVDIQELAEEPDLEAIRKCCPFAFFNCVTTPCQKEKCMAYRYIIDGSGEYVGEYCKLIDKKGE